MTGEGSGGGGALAVLLTLWIGATAFFIGESPLARDPVDSPEPTTAEAGPVILVPAEVDPKPIEQPTPSPAPELPTCDGAACEEPVTRAEMARELSRVFRLPVTTIDFFTDDTGRAEHAAINRVAAAGITSGCDEDRFCPDAEVTRAQLASFLDRALELPQTDADAFADDAGLVHEAAINRVAAAGLTAGCGEGRYCPDGTVTRSQLIRFLGRAVNFDAPSG
jgi:hypothetical protein